MLPQECLVRAVTWTGQALHLPDPLISLVSAKRRADPLKSSSGVL